MLKDIKIIKKRKGERIQWNKTTEKGRQQQRRQIIH